MKYYSKYSFKQSPLSKDSYILESITGTEITKLNLKQYADTPSNRELKIENKKYIYFTKPREVSIAKYFPYVFEGKDGTVITSVEELNESFRTFGDAKRLGTMDLILFQFSKDFKKLDMYFVKRLGSCRNVKQQAFASWNNGEKLSFSK